MALITETELLAATGLTRRTALARHLRRQASWRMSCGWLSMVNAWKWRLLCSIRKAWIG